MNAQTIRYEPSLKKISINLDLKKEITNEVSETKQIVQLYDTIKTKEKVKYRFFLPLKKIHITSFYGDRYHPISKVFKKHNGVDLRASYEDVLSILDGLVIDSGENEKSGKYVVIKHDNYISKYLHLSKINVTKGEEVYAGNKIGISGNTGASTAPHLHFEILKDGVHIDPIKFLIKIIKIINQ